MNFVVDKLKGNIKFPAEEGNVLSNLIGGKHKLCFNNLVRDSKTAGNDITMTLKFPYIESLFNEGAGTHINSPLETKNATEDEHFAHLSSFSEILTSKAKDLGKSQEYEIEKEGEFKDTISKTNSMIQWCAIVQAIVFCILGVWQIISLRRFFAKRGLS